MRRTGTLAILVLSLVAGEGARSQEALEHPAAPVHDYRVVARYPHDPQAFTQGLVYRDGLLYESTGRRGRSELREVRLETGAVLRRRAVADEYFAEGLALWDGRLIQLTWTAGVGFIYGRDDLRPRATFSYPGQGWGLTHDGHHLVMSDGSSTLRFLDPETFEEHRQVRVTDGGVPVRNINELEYVGGEIYANVWKTDRIAVIAPESGRVTGWIDLGELPRPEDRGAVANGIAYDAGDGRLFVTGKLWPSLFEIELIHP